MSSGRDREDIFAAIRRSLRRGPLDPVRAAELAADLASGRRGPALSRVDLPAAELVELFVAMAGKAAATIERIAREEDAPAAIAAFLASENLPAKIAVSPALVDLPWRDRSPLSIHSGPARFDDLVSVTSALAAIAESGSIMTSSARDRPATLNFLPTVHIALVSRKSVVGSYEDAWDLVRLTHPEGMPRTVNFLTGPSRTGDIEQTLMLGAHGPKRLHIFLIG